MTNKLIIQQKFGRSWATNPEDCMYIYNQLVADGVFGYFGIV